MFFTVWLCIREPVFFLFTMTKLSSGGGKEYGPLNRPARPEHSKCFLLFVRENRDYSIQVLAALVVMGFQEVQALISPADCYSLTLWQFLKYLYGFGLRLNMAAKLHAVIGCFAGQCSFEKC